MGRLIVFEVEMDRYLSTPDNQMLQFGGGRDFSALKSVEVRWKGTLKVMVMDGNQLTLHKDLGFIDILDEEYRDALLPHFQKAYETAKGMPMFEEAVLESIGVCHHDRSCDFMSLTIDEEKAEFYANSNEDGYQDKKCAVTFSEKTLQKVENQTKIKFTNFKSIEKEYQVDFFRLWSPQTIRRYSIGGQTIQVFSIGRGDKSRYTLTKETEWNNPNLESIGHFIQGNDVVFHGQRFDFLQVL